MYKRQLLENPKEWDKDTEENNKLKPNPNIKSIELKPVEYKKND